MQSECFGLRSITGMFLGTGQRDEANLADAASPDAAPVVAMTSHALFQPESAEIKETESRRSDVEACEHVAVKAEAGFSLWPEPGAS